MSALGIGVAVLRAAADAAKRQRVGSLAQLQCPQLLPWKGVVLFLQPRWCRMRCWMLVRAAALGMRPSRAPAMHPPDHAPQGILLEPPILQMAGVPGWHEVALETFAKSLLDAAGAISANEI